MGTEGFSTIAYQYFLNGETFVSAELSPKVRKTAYHMGIDFSSPGLLQPSAHMAQRCHSEDRVGR